MILCKYEAQIIKSKTKHFSLPVSSLTHGRLWLAAVIFCYSPYFYRGFPVAQWVKNLPAVQETLVQFLGREDPLEK